MTNGMGPDPYDQLAQEVGDLSEVPTRKLTEQIFLFLQQSLQQQQQIIQLLSSPRQSQVQRGPDGRVVGHVEQIINGGQ